MQKTSPELPKPKKRGKVRLVQAEIPIDLWNNAWDIIRKNGLTIQQAMQYGFEAFVRDTNTGR